MPLIQTRIRVFAFNRATSAPVLSDAANITAKWAKDYGTPTALTDLNPVEAEDGFYYFDLSAGERAVTIIGEIFPESSTSGVQVIGVPAFFLLPPPTVVEISTQIAADIIAEANDWELAAIVFGNYSWDTTLAGPATTAEAFLVSMAGATFDTATDSLEAIRNRGDAAWVTGAVAANVLPAVGIVADRSPGATISPVVGETISQSITLYATDGTTPIDLTGKTLAIVFETMAGVDVAVVANADITVSGTSSNVVTFAYPSAVTASERTLRFAIKDAAAPLTEYLKGICNVTSGPRVDT